MSRVSAEEEMAKLQDQYGPVLVDHAFRNMLVKEKLLGSGESLASAFFSRRNALTDIRNDHLINEIESLLKIGKPLAPAPAVPGAAPVTGTKVHPLGNPPQLDVVYAGGWHFAQDNGWDAWFTFVALGSGGFRVANPACRLTGEHGAAILGYETLAYFSEDDPLFPGILMFQVTWHNGSVGNYQGKYDEVTKTFLGNAGGPVLFEGTRMPFDKVSPPSNFKPVLSCQAYPNIVQDGYTVTVSGSGLPSGEPFEVQGRTEGLGFSSGWGFYGKGSANEFGAFSVTFGVVKPFGVKYIFRAVTGSGDTTPEVGF